MRDSLNVLLENIGLFHIQNLLLCFCTRGQTRSTFFEETAATLSAVVGANMQRWRSKKGDGREGRRGSKVGSAAAPLFTGCTNRWVQRPMLFCLCSEYIGVEYIVEYRTWARKDLPSLAHDEQLLSSFLLQRVDGGPAVDPPPPSQNLKGKALCTLPYPRLQSWLMPCNTTKRHLILTTDWISSVHIHSPALQASC